MENVMMEVVLMEINTKKYHCRAFFKNYKKTINLFIDNYSEVVLVFQRNNAGLKKLPSFF
jgi:hypothetical protein